MNRIIQIIFALVTWATADVSRHPDVLTIAPDVENPAITSGEPAPGKLVLQSLLSYAGPTLHARCAFLPIR